MSAYSGKGPDLQLVESKQATPETNYTLLASHLEAYVKEREDLQYFVTEAGFASYKITGNVCYIKDIYVIPSQRKIHVATGIANAIAAIAKKAGCEILAGSVSPNAKGANDSLLVLINYGMQIQSGDKDILYFAKRIS